MTRALRVNRHNEGVDVEVIDIELVSGLADAELGEGDVTVDVEFSSLNYKDALALTGNPGVARVNPLIPGIDIVGTVAESRDPRWQPGDPVVVNGCGIGETHNGGLAERARVRGDWLVPLPAGLTPRRAAAIGTAGFTAALAVLAVERGGIGRGDAREGDVLVTAASGGVGSIAIALLAASGRHVVAATGSDDPEHLHALGAAEVIDREELGRPGRPLQSARWADAIDAVGGDTLATVLAQTRWGGTVAACGLVGGAELHTTVMPFILRGVTLAGINSVEAPHALRLAAWARLERDLDPQLLDSITTSVTLEGAPAAAERMLAGEGRGRTVVEVRR